MAEAPQNSTETRVNELEGVENSIKYMGSVALGIGVVKGAVQLIGGQGSEAGADITIGFALYGGLHFARQALHAGWMSLRSRLDRLDKQEEV